MDLNYWLIWGRLHSQYSYCHHARNVEGGTLLQLHVRRLSRNVDAVVVVGSGAEVKRKGLIHL